MGENKRRLRQNKVALDSDLGDFRGKRVRELRESQILIGTEHGFIKDSLK